MKVKQLAFFGEMTYHLTDKWSVTGGARWFEYDRKSFDKYQVPFGLPAQQRSGCQRPDEPRASDSDTTFKFATDYHFTPDVMVYALYSEGFRLGGQNSATRGRQRRGAARSLRAGARCRTTRPASRASGSTTSCSSTCRRFSWSGTTSSTTSAAPRGGEAWWIEGTLNGGTAEQKGIEMNGQWYARRAAGISPGTYSSRAPSSRRTHLYRFGSGLSTSLRARLCSCSPKEKYWASVKYAFPPHSVGGQASSGRRFSYNYQGEVWDSLTAARNNTVMSRRCR